MLNIINCIHGQTTDSGVAANILRTADLHFNALAVGVVICGMTTVTRFVASTNRRHSAFSIPHFTFAFRNSAFYPVPTPAPDRCTSKPCVYSRKLVFELYLQHKVLTTVTFLFCGMLQMLLKCDHKSRT